MDHNAMLLNRKLDALVEQSGKSLRELHRLYNRLPATKCLCRARCCSMLPGMNGVEAVSALVRLRGMEAEARERVCLRLLEYFFMNPVRICGCPFLEGGKCIIYQGRFSGCRAYGVWSADYYERITAADRKARRVFQEQWKRAGVELPGEVLDFELPYCRNVKIVKRKKGGYDRLLRKTASAIDELSMKSDSAFHADFGNIFFSDLSFLAASMIWGSGRAAGMKFRIVKEFTEHGDETALATLLRQTDISPLSGYVANHA